MQARHFCAIAAVLCSVTLTAAATSRLEEAVVSDMDGKPCFGIPEHATTRDGLPLSFLAVTEANAGQWPKPPLEMWHVRQADSARPPIVRAQQCIRFGETPPGMVQRSLRTLEPYRLYYVMVGARVKGVNMMGYSAHFCLKPDSAGVLQLAPISSTSNDALERRQACAAQKE